MVSANWLYRYIHYRDRGKEWKALFSDIYDITMCCNTQRLVGQADSVGGRDLNNLEESLCLSLADASASLSPSAVCSLCVILPVIVRCPVWLSGQFVLVSYALLEIDGYVC